MFRTPLNQFRVNKLHEYDTMTKYIVQRKMRSKFFNREFWIVEYHYSEDIAINRMKQLFNKAINKKPSSTIIAEIY